MAEIDSSGKLPDLCDEGHVLVVTKGYHQPAVAVAVIMRNLLSRFSPESFSLITTDVPTAKRRHGRDHDYLMPLVPSFWPKRWLDQWRVLQTPYAVRRTIKLIRENDVRVIVAIHQDMQAITIAREAAKATKTPWMPYIHNMIWENYRDTKYEKQALRLQKQTFAEASSILVMCDGIADLYRERYGFESRTMVHNHIEPVPEDLRHRPIKRQCFLAGAIYQINARAAKRVFDAAGKVGLPLVITASNSPEALASHGIAGEGVRKEFYPERSDYLLALEEQGVLVTALDWPDESPESDDELATLLPTRIVEYLASGRPVLAHCPEGSFMAKYLRKYNCATVVSERSVDALADAIRHLLEGGDDVDAMRRAGLQTVREVFAIDKVAAAFREEINAVAKLKWSEKLR